MKNIRDKYDKIYKRQQQKKWTKGLNKNFTTKSYTDGK